MEEFSSHQNEAALLALVRALQPLEGDIDRIKESVDPIWEALDDDRTVQPSDIAGVKQAIAQARSHLDALEQEVDKYQP